MCLDNVVTPSHGLGGHGATCELSIIRLGVRAPYAPPAAAREMKSKIIILSAFLSPIRSGAEACAEEVAVRLADQYDVTIVTARMRRNLQRRDLLQGKIPVLRIGFGFGFDKWLYPFLVPIIAQKLMRHFSMHHDEIIIHAILETYAGLALFFCRFLCPRAKRILTLQTTNRNFLKCRIIRSADRVTAISSVLVKIAKQCGKNDVTSIPNGLNLNHVPIIPKVPGRILFVGRLEKMKGIDTLLNAFKNAQCHSPTPHAPRPTPHLRIVGDGSERKNLERLAQTLGIADRVTFTGFVPIPKVYEEFAKAEIFCGLSRSEALGNVFLEAQAAGCAVIGTHVGGIPDIVADGVTGLLVPPDEPKAAWEAIQMLLEDIALRERLGVAGKKHASRYDWSAIAERYREVYSGFSTSKNTSLRLQSECARSFS